MASLAIKISADLATAARAAAELADRSLTAQIEHWARMGKKMDEQVTGGAMMAFKRTAGGTATIQEPAYREEIETVLAQLRQPGFATKVALAARDLEIHEVLYGADPDGTGLIVAHYRDGRKTKGRMVNRVFEPQETVQRVAKSTAKTRTAELPRLKT